MHDARAHTMHDARVEKIAMHVHIFHKKPVIGARKKGMGPLFYAFQTIFLPNKKFSFSNFEMCINRVSEMRAHSLSEKSI